MLRKGLLINSVIRSFTGDEIETILVPNATRPLTLV